MGAGLLAVGTTIAGAAVGANLVLLDVDFPMQKKQSDAQKKANEALSDKFKIEGYPTLVVVNAEGNQLWREEGYAGESPKEYVAKLKKIPR